MSAGTSHQGYLVFNCTTPAFDHHASGSVAYADNYCKRGITCSIVVESTSASLEYTIVSAGTLVSGSSGNVATASEAIFSFSSADAVLFDSNNRILSESGNLVMGGQIGSIIFGRFSFSGAGVFLLPQSFAAQWLASPGNYQFGFEEQ